MSDPADFQPIRNIIEGCWPGEWGSDPIGDQSNCTVYRATDIDDDGHLSLEAGAARVVIPAKLIAKALRKGDLLLEAAGGAPDRPVGRVALVATHPSKPSLTSNFFRFMRPKANIDPTFLTFQLVALNRSSAIWRYQQQTTGLINLKVHDYLSHPVWTPPLPTQQKIASILSTIDTAIEQTEALIEKYQHIKAGLMHDLFTRGVLPNGQLRPPRDQAPELYQKTAIGWIPRGWVVKPLGSLCEMTSGGTPSRNVPDFWGGSIPWIKTGEIKYREISDAEEHITQRGLNASSAKIFPAGTVVMAMYGEGVTRGRVAILAKPCASNQACIGFFFGSQVQSTYMYYFFEYSYEALRDLSNDGSQKNLSSGLLRQFEISHPISKSEQKHIAIRLSALDGHLASEEKHLQNLNNQKLGLMQDLLTGKVPVVVDSSDNAAHA